MVPWRRRLEEEKNDDKKQKRKKSKRGARDEEKREHAEKTLVSRKLETSVRKTVGKLRGGGESGDEVAGIYDG